jgi:hypothetical protein
VDLLVAPGASSLDKARAVVGLDPSMWKGRVIDVGCRNRELERALAGTPTTYVGVDLSCGGDTRADVGAGLPFADNAAGVVVALDVLEHADHLHNAFDELCRVAANDIVISLPNCYEASMRLRMLEGGPANGKYGLPLDEPADRHRWFFSFDEARRFCDERAGRAGWSISDERALVGPRRAARLRGALRRWPNLLAPTYVVRLSNRNGARNPV